jgi:hypothetical protein
MPRVVCHTLQHPRGSRIYPGLVLELSSLDLGEIAEALADQTDYEHRWLINPATGETRSRPISPGCSPAHTHA